MAGNKTSLSRIRVKLSRIQFPEICPVCLEDPEDLVFVTILEKTHDGTWAKQQDKLEIALNAARGATTFAVPTCMRHGSKSVRSLRTRLIAALGFFVLFYPILFFLLRINVALVYSRPLLQPVLGFLSTTSILILVLVYGLFPRALERAIRFHDVSRAKDAVFLSISNTEYHRLFLDLNEMVSDIVIDDEVETDN
jgi:hypothetical protein